MWQHENIKHLNTRARRWPSRRRKTSFAHRTVSLHKKIYTWMSKNCKQTHCGKVPHRVGHARSCTKNNINFSQSNHDIWHHDRLRRNCFFTLISNRAPVHDNPRCSIVGNTISSIRLHIPSAIKFNLIHCQTWCLRNDNNIRRSHSAWKIIRSHTYKIIENKYREMYFLNQRMSGCIYGKDQKHVSRTRQLVVLWRVCQHASYINGHVCGTSIVFVMFLFCSTCHK